MEADIDYTKTAQQNAELYFDKSKKAKRKAEGARNAIKELEGKLSEIENEKEERKIKKIEKKEWYEKFNWFFTSNGMLAIGGRSAEQNDEVYAKYLDDDDLFFHADIFGASATVLKNGTNAPKQIREEVAQFAACYSRAWGDVSSANVYALKKEQVSKSKEKGSLGTGSFLLSGEREWFKNMSLELCAFIPDIKVKTPQPSITSMANSNFIVETGKVNIVPLGTCRALGLSHYVYIKPGNTKKSDASKFIAKVLKYESVDYIMQHLPQGPFSVKEIA